MCRHFFGAASLVLGVASVARHEQLISNWQLPGDAAFIVVTSAGLIIGGTAMQFRKIDTLGAITLGVVYLLFVLTFVPDVLTQPGEFASWGNVFYGLSLVAGALVAYGVATPLAPYAKTICKVAGALLGLCCVSFAVEQVEFLGRTADLVPKWLPPSGMSWAVATTIAFGLAGVSIVTGYKSLLASRLLALMLVTFGVAIWIPTLIADPRTHSNWSEGLETFAIAGAAWIVADFLRRESLVRKSR